MRTWRSLFEQFNHPELTLNESGSSQGSLHTAHQRTICIDLRNNILNQTIGDIPALIVAEDSEHARRQYRLGLPILATEFASSLKAISVN
jgi:hypothetical protein